MTRTAFIFHLDLAVEKPAGMVAYYCNGCNVEEHPETFAAAVGRTVEEFKQYCQGRGMFPEWVDAEADLTLLELDRFSFVFVVRERVGFVTAIEQVKPFSVPDFEKINA